MQAGVLLRTTNDTSYPMRQVIFCRICRIWILATVLLINGYVTRQHHKTASQDSVYTIRLDDTCAAFISVRISFVLSSTFVIDGPGEYIKASQNQIKLLSSSSKPFLLQIPTKLTGRFLDCQPWHLNQRYALLSGNDRVGRTNSVPECYWKTWGCSHAWRYELHIQLSSSIPTNNLHKQLIPL